MPHSLGGQREVGPHVAPALHWAVLWESCGNSACPAACAGAAAAEAGSFPCGWRRAALLETRDFPPTGLPTPFPPAVRRRPAGAEWVVFSEEALG